MAGIRIINIVFMGQCYGNHLEIPTKSKKIYRLKIIPALKFILHINLKNFNSFLDLRQDFSITPNRHALKLMIK